MCGFNFGFSAELQIKPPPSHPGNSPLAVVNPPVFISVVCLGRERAQGTVPQCPSLLPVCGNVGTPPLHFAREPGSKAQQLRRGVICSWGAELKSILLVVLVPAPSALHFPQLLQL